MATILQTSDAGANWYQLDPGVAIEQNLNAIYFTNPNTGYAVGTAGTIIKTIDAGTSWSPLGAGTTENLRSIYFTDANTGYMVGGSGTILKTTDAGANWIAQVSGTLGVLTDVYFINASTGFVTTDTAGSILQTIDGGSNWSTLDSGVTNSSLLGISFDNAGTGFAVGSLGTVIKIRPKYNSPASLGETGSPSVGLRAQTANGEKARWKRIHWSASLEDGTTAIDNSNYIIQLQVKPTDNSDWSGNWYSANNGSSGVSQDTWYSIDASGSLSGDITLDPGLSATDKLEIKINMKSLGAHSPVLQDISLYYDILDPPLANNLKMFKNDGTTEITGGQTNENLVKLRLTNLSVAGNGLSDTDSINAEFQYKIGAEGSWTDTPAAVYDGGTQTSESLLTGLSAGNTYYFRGRIKDTAATGQNRISNWTNFSSTLEVASMSPPNAPTIGTPSALSTTSIRWNFTDNASNEVGFKVHDATHTIVASNATANLSYIDETSLTPNTQYTRHVHAYNAQGDSAASANASLYTLANIPGTPTVNASWSAANGYYTDITVDGNSNPGTTNYAVTSDDGTNWVQADGSLSVSEYWQTSTSFTHKNLSANTAYSYKVKAKNGDNVETALNSTAGSDTTPPAAPTALAHTSNTTSSITWDWADTTAATSYVMHNASEEVIATGIATSNYTQTTSNGLLALLANTSYGVHVHAVNANGVGAASSASSAYTSIEAASGIGFGTITSSSIAVSDSGAFTNLTTGSSSLLFTNTTTSTNSGWIQTNAWTSSLLDPNTQYSFKAQSRNADADTTTETSISSKYTLANTPAAPTVSDATSLSLKVTININSNPANTTYAIYNNTATQYVQADGTLGAGAVYQTYSAWGGVLGIVNTGLTSETSYTYKAIARNGDNVDTDFSANSTPISTLPDAPPLVPTMGVPTTLSTTSVRWNFTDSANNEIGFRLHDEMHNLLSTVATPNLSYIDETSLTPNTSYTRYVHAYNSAGNSDASASASRYTLADAPTLASATDGTYVDKINVSWSVSLSASSYKVYRDGLSGVGTLVYNSTGTSFDDTITGSHTYYIYSVNGEAVENTSDVINDSGSTMVAPSAPTIGAATALSPTSISWSFSDTSNNEEGFKLYNISDSLRGSASANSSSITETSLTPNTSYSRYVKAFNAAGESTASAVATRVTLPVAPNLSSDKTANSYSNTTDVVFSNLAGFGAGSLSYYRYVFNQNPTYTFLDTENQWLVGTFTGTATATGNWYLHLKSYNSEGAANSSTATYGPFGYDNLRPNDVVNLQATAASSTQIDLSYNTTTDNGPAGLNNYRIERSLNDNSNYSVLSNSPTSNSYTDTTASANTRYYYKVKAIDKATNESLNYSNEVNVATLSSAPSGVSVSDSYYADKIGITITSGGSQERFLVYRDGIGGIGTLIYNGSSTSIEDNISGSHSYYVYSVNIDDVVHPTYATDTGSTGTISAPANSNIAQQKVSQATVVSVGGYTNETAIIIRVNQMAGLGSSTSLTPQVEVKETAANFDGLTNIFSSSSVSYSGSAVSSTVQVTGLEANKSYHYRYRVKDNNNATSDWLSFNSANTAFSVDVTAPSLSFSSPANSAFVKGTITLASSPSDNVGIAGVSYYDNSLSKLINSVVSPYSTSWYTVGKDGGHTLYSVAEDLAGSKTTVAKTVYVDNYRPRTYASYSASVRRYSYVKLYWKATDPYTRGYAYIVIRIKKGSTTVKTINLGLKPINALRYYLYKAALAKYRYKFYIYARDRAGNTQYNIASNYLTIK